MSRPKQFESQADPSRFRTIGFALLLALVAIVTTTPAAAFFAPGVRCNHDSFRPDICRIDLAPGLAVDAGRQSIFPHTDGGGFDVVGTIEIPTGTDPIVMAQADMRFRTTSGSSKLIYATGLLPFPQIGFLEAIEIQRQPRVSFGVRKGLELAFMGAPLQDEHDYFYFHKSGILAAGYDPISAAPPGAMLSVVLDPTDPYFYVAGEMSGLGAGDSQKDSKSSANNNGNNNGNQT